MRSLKIQKSTAITELKKSLKSAFFNLESATEKDFYLSSPAENVFCGAREAIQFGGKYYKMFVVGDGNEILDYTDERGRFHLAHAKSIYSSSMLAYNFFHWVSAAHPLHYKGITYDKVCFEVKMKVLEKNQKGQTIHKAANMDVVFISTDCKTMLCIESKFLEHLQNAASFFPKPYCYPESYYEGNPFRLDFARLASLYNFRGQGYYSGIQQNIRHLVAISNLKYDANALAWFKSHNPYVESEILDKINADTQFIFTNFLYYPHEDFNSRSDGKTLSDSQTYTDLLMNFESDLPNEVKNTLLTIGIYQRYADVLSAVKEQMPDGLYYYLSKRYLLK